MICVTLSSLLRIGTVVCDEGGSACAEGAGCRLSLGVAPPLRGNMSMMLMRRFLGSAGFSGIRGSVAA